MNSRHCRETRTAATHHRRAVAAAGCDAAASPPEHVPFLRLPAMIFNQAIDQAIILR